jgi:hypothetical protein
MVLKHGKNHGVEGSYVSRIDFLCRLRDLIRDRSLLIIVRTSTAHSRHQASQAESRHLGFPTSPIYRPLNHLEFLERTNQEASDLS